MVTHIQIILRKKYLAAKLISHEEVYHDYLQTYRCKKTRLD